MPCTSKRSGKAHLILHQTKYLRRSSFGPSIRQLEAQRTCSAEVFLLANFRKGPHSAKPFWETCQSIILRGNSVFLKCLAPRCHDLDRGANWRLQPIHSKNGFWNRLEWSHSMRSRTSCGSVWCRFICGSSLIRFWIKGHGDQATVASGHECHSKLQVQCLYRNSLLYPPPMS